MKTKNNNGQRVWLASLVSHFGVNTRAFSSKAKAQAWKKECEAVYQEGNAEFALRTASGWRVPDAGSGPYFSIRAVRVDSRDFINEG